MKTPGAPSLPDDPALLRATIENLAAQLADAKRRIQALQHQVDLLRRSAYGRKSEKVVLDQLLLAFSGLTEQVAEIEKAHAQAEEAAAVAAEKAAGHGRRRLPADLPRETVRVEVPQAERPCPKCGAERATIGFAVSERLEYVPAQVKIQVVEREKLACKSCAAHVATADPPPQPIEKALPGPRLLARIVTNKYADHLPLYRQEGIFERIGIRIARSTMVGWLVPTALLLKPIAEAMLKDVLRSRAIHGDDTPVPVLDPQLDRTREGRLWAYCGDRDHPCTVYLYSPDRKGEHPRAHLEGFAGFLHADAWSGFDALFRSGLVIEVACWAHVRRKFFDSRSLDAVFANTALAWIRKLYDIEDLAEDFTDDERRALRQEKAVPLLGKFKEWLQESSLTLLPQSPLGQAVSYALKNWDALNRYTEHGFLDIDNNAAERALRCVAVGRKNWEFAGSDDGGHRAAVFYSLVATCKLHEVDPEAYIADVLMRVATTPRSRIADLFPHNWAKARLKEAAEAARQVAQLAQ